MERRVVVLGVGNALCQDDGIGPLVVGELARRHSEHRIAEWIDAGTVGLALLSYLEDRDGLVVVDAAALDASPGDIEVLEGESMDRFVAQPRQKRSVHEVGLADLLGAAAFCSTLPRRRALIAIQPGSTQLGSEPTAAVGAAVERACSAVLDVLERWSSEELAA